MFNKGKYRVYFKHYPLENDYINGLEYTGRTECYITEDDEQIRFGESFCGVNDIFNKSVGRKVSLARALEGADKEFRTLIWSEYLDKVTHL